MKQLSKKQKIQFCNDYLFNFNQYDAPPYMDEKYICPLLYNWVIKNKILEKGVFIEVNYLPLGYLKELLLFNKNKGDAMCCLGTDNELRETIICFVLAILKSRP